MDGEHRVARGSSPSLLSIEDASSQLPAATTDTESSPPGASSSTSVPPAEPISHEDDCEKNASPPEVSNQDSNDIYNRFSPRKKRAIVAVVSFAALLAPFASSSFLPSIPQISLDMRVSPAVINYTVAIYLIVIAVTPLAWSPYSTYYGRQKIYLLSLPIFIAGSIGVAESRSLVSLIVTRIIQGAGSSSVLAVGAGSIGDIYRPAERGRAMGIFYAGALVGPAISPVVAGIMTEYVHGSRGSWRAFQYLMAAMGCLSFMMIVLFLPETSHRLGRDAQLTSGTSQAEKNKRKLVWLNPLRPLKLLKYRNVLAISLTSASVLLTTYSILTPLTLTLGARFGITNEALLGTLYLAPGIGNMVGSPLSGYLSDYTVSRWKARRSSQFIPEDRLRASVVAGGLVIPLSLVGAGLTMQLWTTTAGMALTLVFLLINGAAIVCVLAICNTYLVDVMQKKSAEAIAVNNCLRYIAAAGSSAAMVPLIDAIGIWPTNTITAGIGLVGFFLMCLTIRYGKHWREKDAGKYSDNT